MQSLLGRIVEICSDQTRHKITIEPLCTLPDRKAPPDHLKGQKLTFEREVFDIREIGELGDSIVLKYGEAFRFLHPLLFHWNNLWRLNALPNHLSVALIWWKDEAPPRWTARSGSKTISGAWQKEKWGWECSVPLGELIAHGLAKPFEIQFTCGELQRKCTVAPNETSFITQNHEADATFYHLENLWFQTDISPHRAGSIKHLNHSYEGVHSVHFSDSQLIQDPLNNFGHTDRFRSGWGEWNAMREVTLDACGTSREANSSRVTMEGEIEDGLRTQFSATLLDDWPLLLMRRDFSLHAKKEEKKDELKQPIDEMRLFQYGFRCAVKPDQKSSRVWCRADGETMTFSLAHENENQAFWHWKIENGWALFEQAARREFLLYFFDAENAPHLGLARGAHFAALEPFWAGVPLKAGDSVGFSLALAAGEIGGANECGAWVVCRTTRNNEWHFALMARLENSDCDAVFRVGTETKRVPLTALYLPSIGTVHGAKTTFKIAAGQSDFAAFLERSAP